MEKINKKLFFWIGALALLGGGMNVFALLQFSIAVSHTTGNITRMSIDLSNNNFPHLFLMIKVVGSFLIGAVVSGIIIGSGRDFELKKRYGDTFIFIGILLKVLDLYLLNTNLFIYVLAVSLGLQNGLFIRYRGILIRTTHMTGTITDLGVIIGHYLRGNKEVGWKIKYYAMNIISFIFGGLCIGICIKYLGKNAINVLSGAYIVVGLYYFLLRDRYYRIKD